MCVCVYGCTQQSLGAHPHVCPDRKQILMVAHKELEEPIESAGDPGRGGSGPLCAIPLHLPGKYKPVYYFNLKKKEKALTTYFKRILVPVTSSQE